MQPRKYNRKSNQDDQSEFYSKKKQLPSKSIQQHGDMSDNYDNSINLSPK